MLVLDLQFEVLRRTALTHHIQGALIVGRKHMRGGGCAAPMSAGCAALADRDVAVAAAAAAAGAMTSELVADILAQPLQEDVIQEIQAKREEHGRALTAEEVRDIWGAKATQITQIAKLTGALSGLFTGDADGITLAYTAGNNAIDNNFMQKTVPVLWAAMELGLLEAAGTLNPHSPLKFLENF